MRNKRTQVKKEGKVQYFALVGIGTRKASGLIRYSKTRKGIAYHRLNGKGKWIFDPSIARYLMGYSDLAEPVSRVEAIKIRREIIKYVKDKQER